MRSLWARPALAAVATALLVAPSSVQAQPADMFPQTVYWGTGLVSIPVAWVAPRNAEFFYVASGKRFRFENTPAEPNWKTAWNTHTSIETHWLGRITAGVAAYSQNPEWGFFGQALLLRENQIPFLPGIAVGVRNLGPYEHTDRFFIGHDILLDPESEEYEEFVSHYYENFSTAPTLYAVATKSFMLGGPENLRMPSLDFTVGWGNGLFEDDGDRGDSYNMRGTIAPGLFLGSRFTMRPTENTTVHLMAENDGWDWNAGLVGDWRGISLGLYVTELEEGSENEPDTRVYNYRKWNLSVGYSGNIVDVSRGVILRTRISDLMRERERLLQEIAVREQRIAALERALRRLQELELADIERRRLELEAEIEAEREAIRRAEERLRRIDEQNPNGSLNNFNRR